MASKSRFLDNPGVGAFGSSNNSLTSTSASYAATATSASYAVTASHALFAVSASHEIVKEVSSSHANTADIAGGLQGQPSISVTNITASSNISSSGTVTGLSGSFSELSGNSPLTVNGTVNFIDTVNLSSNISGSATSTASFGTYLGDGSQLSNISTTPFPFTGDAQITGSLVISGSNTITFGLPDAANRIAIGGSGNSFHIQHQGVGNPGLGDPLPAILTISGSGGTTGGNQTLNIGSRSSTDDTIGDETIVRFNFFTGGRLTTLAGGTLASNAFVFSVSGSSVNGNGGVISLGRGGTTPSNSAKIHLNGHLTASADVNISASATSTSSFGTYLGDGSQLSGISSTPFPFTGDAQITGSLIVTGSFIPTGKTPLSVYNVIIGREAGEIANAQTSYNVFVGGRAGGQDNDFGDKNVLVGYEAGYLGNQTGNTSIGYYAGRGWGTTGATPTTGYNTSIGYRSGYGAATRTTETHNTLLGAFTGRNLTAGSGNTLLGYYAGYNNLGDGNIIIGSGSVGVASMTNQLRIGNGESVTVISASLTTGDIILQGNVSSSATSTASFGTYIGDGSQLSGVSSTPFPFTGDAQITGSLTVSGSFVPHGKGPTSNVIIGNLAGDSITSGGVNNVYIGQEAGEAAGSGDANVVIGWKAGEASTNDSGCILIGYKAGGASTLGNYNTFIGYEAGRDATSTAGNVGIGHQALFESNAGGGSGYNTALGWKSGYSITSGNYNLFIGHEAGYDITTGANNIIIGSGSKGEAAITNQLRIGHASLITISASLTTGDILLQGDVSSSATSTASFGTYIGDGSQLSGISAGSTFPFNGDAVITGSLVVSSSNSTTALTVEGSGSNVFEVLGSVGTLFSVDDSLTGTVFSANDISGLPVLQADATGEVYLGKSPQSLYTTATISSTTANITQSIYGLSTSSYEGVFVDYTATSASNARAGNITAIWNGSSLNFAETTTTDIGDTSNLIMQIAISQSQAQVQSYSTAASYKIKTIIRSI